MDHRRLQERRRSSGADREAPICALLRNDAASRGVRAYRGIVRAPGAWLVVAGVERGGTCRRVTQLARLRHLSTRLFLGLKAKADAFVVGYPNARDAKDSVRHLADGNA